MTSNQIVIGVLRRKADTTSSRWDLWKGLTQEEIDNVGDLAEYFEIDNIAIRSNEIMIIK